MALPAAPRLDVRWIDLPDLPTLGTWWRDLESRSDAGFFVRWDWIGRWLATLPPSVTVRCQQARDGGRTVGLALWGEAAPESRWARRPTLHLHASGVEALDDIWIEHNGPLVEAADAPAIRAAMLDHALGGGNARWSGLRLPGVPEALQADLPRRSVWRGWSQSSWLIDLDAVRARGPDSLGVLSSSTRTRIKRTRKQAEQLGPLRVETSADVPQALAMFERLCDLHRRRWADRDTASAFDTPFARDFHEGLLRGAAAGGRAFIMGVHAGEHELGYVYLFAHDGRVSFYQSGFDYERLGRQGSVGLLTLWSCIEVLARQGHRLFDLLAGEMPYKRELSSHVEPLHWLTVEPATVTNRLKHLARRRLKAAAPLVRRAVQQPLRAGIQALALTLTPVMAVMPAEFEPLAGEQLPPVERTGELAPWRRLDGEMQTEDTDEVPPPTQPPDTAA